VSLPRWDGRSVLFEITDGAEQVPCAISGGALEEIDGRRYFKPADLLSCFTAARGRIEVIALHKLRTSPLGISGRLNLWADDVDPLPAAGASVVACCADPAEGDA
jgi:Protein of unknown function (DUF1488)